jgi:hypothetical protein
LRASSRRYHFRLPKLARTFAKVRKDTFVVSHNKPSPARAPPVARSRVFDPDKSRGYCLEMICADFRAGAHLDNGNPEMLLNSITRFFKFLPGEQRQHFLSCLDQKAS